VARLPIKHCSGAGYSPGRATPPPAYHCSRAFLLWLVYGVVWLRQATTATCVAEQTVFIHPGSTLSPFHSVSLSHGPSLPRSSLHLSRSLRTAHRTGDSVLTLTSRYRLTNHCRNCNCMQLFPFSSLAFDLKSELDHARRFVLPPPKIAHAGLNDMMKNVRWMKKF